MANDVLLWKGASAGGLPADAKSTDQIVSHIKQLTTREKSQLVNAFQHGDYEIAVSFVWSRAMAALKRQLATVGMSFIGEILGRPDIVESSDPSAVISHSDAIRLSAEFGVVTQTEALRLRQMNDLVTHFDSLDPDQADAEGVVMDEDEAKLALKAAVRNILSKEKIEVASEFSEFRRKLEEKQFSSSDPEVTSLVASPYFFKKIAISILLALAKRSKGAQLENALANFNLVLPLVWVDLTDIEKWQVGTAYAEMHNEGQSTSLNGLKKALLKVKGFDFVPESLRSNSFIAAADKVLLAHGGMNNFYNEEPPIRELQKMGTTIPTPAFPICARAVLSVFLGNYYGRSFAAAPVAEKIMDGFTEDRWAYYFAKCLPSDVDILSKLADARPRANFIFMVKKFNLGQVEAGAPVLNLLRAAASANDQKVKEAADRLLDHYYKGKAPI